MPTIAELMTHDPLYVRQQTLLSECAHHLVNWPVRHLPVVDQRGAITGMISRHAVFGRGQLAPDGTWVPHDMGDRWLRAADLEQKIPLLAQPGVDARQVLLQLLRSYGDSVVVVDEDKHPVGILTEHDAACIAARMLDDTRSTRSLPPRQLVTVDRLERASYALWLMTLHKLRHVLVTSGEALFGVLSYRDLAAEVVQADDPLVEDLVTSVPPVYRAGHVPMAETARLMAKCAIGCVPIVSRSMKPIQVVTRTDVIEALLPHLEPVQNRPEPIPS